MNDLKDAPAKFVTFMDTKVIQNTNEVDKTLIRIYKYFYYKGYFNAIIGKIVSLATLTFVVLFSLFLFNCIDYSMISKFTNPDITYDMGQAITLKNLFSMNIFFWMYIGIFIIFFGWKIVEIIYDSKILKDIKQFYNNQLDIKDKDLHTIKWNEITTKLIDLHDKGTFLPELDNLTTLEIANRIMRIENYMMALFNEEIINVSVPLPEKVETILKNKPKVFTKIIEWNIKYCMCNFIFDQNMLPRKELFDDSRTNVLKTELNKRFYIMGLMNLLMTPFTIVYILMYILFRYGEEIYKNPSEIGSREWSLLAKWRIREFNELPHIFMDRLNLSSKYAKKYLQNFSSRWETVGMFIILVLGSLLMTIVLLSFINGNLLLNVELFGEPMIWYVGMISSLLIVVKSLIGEKNRNNPAKSFNKVKEYIHYIPDEWDPTADETRNKMTRLYQYRLYSLIKEIVTIPVIPFILWFSLPNSTDSIIHFVREFSTDDSKLGHVCEFALFNLENSGEHCSNHKIEKSIINFKDNNPSFDDNLLNMTIIPTTNDSSGDDVLYHSTHYDLEENV